MKEWRPGLKGREGLGQLEWDRRALQTAEGKKQQRREKGEGKAGARGSDITDRLFFFKDSYGDSHSDQKTILQVDGGILLKHSHE